jgi:hypothetical protein
MRAELATFCELSGLLQGVGRRLAFLPVGCTEQHGPLLPLGTDTLVADAMASALCAHLAGNGWRGVVYPPLAYTPSRSNADYPGSTTVDENSFRGYAQEVCGAILHHPFDALVLVCMHGPAEPSLIELAFRLNQAGFAAGGPVRPLIVLGVTRYAGVFQRVLGDSAGKHADFKEFLLLFKVLGSDFFPAEKIAGLQAFGMRYRGSPPPMVGLPGMPMAYRSVDGVIGLPWPEQAVDYPVLAAELWARLLEAFAETVKQAFADLERI